MLSKLQKNPKSKILEKGYINIYSALTPQEKRQVRYKTEFKNLNPDWDESMVYLSKKLGEFLSGKEKVLDIGCGNGNYLIDENRKKIAWAAGIDADANSVKKNQCLDEIKIGDIGELPFNDNSFDLVVSLWVLEHLKNPAKVFSEVHRVLKKDGRFLFVTPNYNFIPLKLVRIKRLNRFLNKYLFGRREEDVFPTFYRANSLAQIKDLVDDKFDVTDLKTNYDPSYTSFNDLSFKVSNSINAVFSNLGLNVTHAHILGILQKN